jgi:hypothetical protein
MSAITYKVVKHDGGWAYEELKCATSTTGKAHRALVVQSCEEPSELEVVSVDLGFPIPRIVLP